MRQMRMRLQAAVDAVGDFLRAIVLRLSAVKSEAIKVQPRAAARRHTGCVFVDGVSLPWRLTVRYLGLIIDHRLTWYPAVKQLRAAMRRVEGAVRALLARDGCPPCSRWGCTVRWRGPRCCTRSHCAACDRICGDTSTATTDECSACATAGPAHPVWRRRSQRPARGRSPSPLICARLATPSAYPVPQGPAPYCPASADVPSLVWDTLGKALEQRNFSLCTTLGGCLRLYDLVLMVSVYPSHGRPGHCPLRTFQSDGGPAAKVQHVLGQGEQAMRMLLRVSSHFHGLKEPCMLPLHDAYLVSCFGYQLAPL
ncbi:hypothetical protein HPB49_004428 [Dermacentor silvarum]|uniref:Uncharacterized protein n=1 Tax=Dermacentor silvarum TaxID=543639 RepID=A0ACB8DUA3_DERSI|nr:hypothetical protein HPB49_004428 [Dermacentor silvarum]